MTKQSSTSKYFDRYLQIAPFSHAIWRAIEAETLGKYNLKKPIIDIGCGFGEFAGVFFSSQIEVGVDINPDDIQLAAESGKFKKTIIADARNLPFRENNFNTAISISTLEHIKNNDIVFKEVFKILKPGGKFYLTVPTNKMNDGLLIVRLLRFLGQKKISNYYIRRINDIFRHVSLFSEEKWLKKVKGAGFEVMKTQGTVSPILLALWELGLLPALPSQIIKNIFGKRVIIGKRFRSFIFRPLIEFIKVDPDFKANLFVVAQKPLI